MGIIWVNHHTAFNQIARVDRTFLMLNVFFLMFVAFIPYPTGLLTEHLGGAGAERAALLYGATLTGTAVCTNLWWLYASRWRHLLRHDAAPRLVAGITRSYLAGPVIYLVATLVALVSPNLAAALYAAIAVFYVVESSRFGGRTRRSGEHE
jgi:TMEM175 potassium channel family protein